MRVVRFAFALTCLLIAVPLRAESYVFRLDPAATKVTFLLDAFMHKVHGTAPLVRGEIRFDDSGKAAGEVVVDATRMGTGSEGRDQDMHAKVLESAKYKEIVLAVDGFEGRFDPAAPSTVKVKGRFTIHGAEHPLTMEMTLAPQSGAAGAGVEKRLEATATFTVPYVEWGMKDPSKVFLRVGKVVDVTIEARGSLVAGP